MKPALVTSRETVRPDEAALLKHNLRSAAIALNIDRDQLLKRLCGELGYDNRMLGYCDMEPTLDRRQFEPLVRRLLTMQMDGLGFGWKLT